ncbi:translation elongation factor Ts [Buchnera aphidicola (Formosaphis micheliae)]|uniref:translation elongation factor Ts n=1 Tax=Buchnera aphidicola TaxID=9 RepID=UPI0031B849AE
MVINITASLIKELRLRTGVGIMDCKKALLKTSGNIELSIDYLRKIGQAKADIKNNRSTAQGSLFIYKHNNVAAMLELSCETDFVAKSKEFIYFGNSVIKQVCLKCIKDIHLIRNIFQEKNNELITQCREKIVINRINLCESEIVDYYIHSNRIGVLVGATKSSDMQIIHQVAMHIAASKPEYLNKDMVPEDVIQREKNIQLDIAIKSGKSVFLSKKIVEGRMNKFLSEVSLMGQKFIMNSEKTIFQLLVENNSIVTCFTRFEVGETFKKKYL